MGDAEKKSAEEYERTEQAERDDKSAKLRRIDEAAAAQAKAVALAVAKAKAKATGLPVPEKLSHGGRQR